MYFNEKYRQRVINRGDNYEYIGSYKTNEITIDGKNKKGKQTYIKVKCPYCGEKYYVSLINFTKKKVKCTYCCNSYEKSFAYHIQQELGEDLNKYWDWEKNTVNPYHIYKSSNKTKVWIKCTKTDYHESNLISPANFVRGDRCPYCSTRRGKVHPKDSFAQWGIDNIDKDFLTKYWSNKNDELGINPWKLTPHSTNKIYIYCQEKDYHNDDGGYLTTCDRFYQGNRCPYCVNQKIHPKDSFGQWLIDEFGNDAIEKYWSPKNTLDPFTIAPKINNKKVWILCQEKDYHNDNKGYPISPLNFYKGARCPYCVNQKIHPKDSFGALYPSKAKHWSEKNDKSPFEVAPKTDAKYKFICQECGEEFDRSLLNLNKNNTGVICRNCVSSQLEQETSKILQKYNIEYEREKEFEKLIGKGNKPLRYDFYLQDYNLLIECQGIQHKEWQKTWITKKDFERQLIHDKRKKQYAIDHNINFLEIWYYDIDNIEQILTKQLNLEYRN
mgnify:CR=1 FL=1